MDYKIEATHVYRTCRRSLYDSVKRLVFRFMNQVAQVESRLLNMLAFL